MDTTEQLLERTGFHDQAPFGCLATDCQGRILAVNRWCCEITGYDRSDLIGRPLRVLFAHGAGGRDDIDILIDSARGGAAQDERILDLRCHGGGQRRLRITVEPIIGDGDKVEEILLIWKQVDGLAAASAEGDRLITAVTLITETLRHARSWERPVGRILRYLGDAARVSRVCLYQKTVKLESDEAVSLRFEWVGEHGRPLLERLDCQTFFMSSRGFSRWREMLAQDRILCGNVDSLPDSERRLLEPIGLQSILIVPVFIRGDWWGYLGLDNFDRHRAWDALEQQALKTAASVLGGAIERTLLEDSERDTREQLDHMLGVMPALLYTLDAAPLEAARAGRLEFISASVERLLGYSRSECRQFQDWWLDNLHPEHREQALARRSDLLRDGFLDLEYRFRRADGEYIWIHDSMRLIRDADGSPRRIIGTWMDISASKKTGEGMRLAACVFENTEQGILVTDAKARIIDVNPAFSRCTGYPREEVLGRNPSLLQSGRQGPSFYQSLWRAIEETDHWRGEIWNRRKNGEVYPEFMTINAVRDEHGTLTNYVAIFTDISRHKQYQEQLEHLTHYDALTGLPNRTLFKARLEQSMRHAQRNGTRVGLLFIDLDNFRQVNDNLGHVAGDRLLQEETRRLRSCVREEDTIARLGGDEFAIVLADCHDSLDLSLVARKVISATQRPFPLEIGEGFSSASIGISIYPDDATDFDGLTQYADIALYQAKSEGRNTFQFYASEMSASAFDRMLLANNLRKALKEEEFALHFQPIMELGSAQPMGFEALIRWQHPDMGMIPPDRFIPLAEESGQIIAIGAWVLETALRRMAYWRQQWGRDIHLAVNVSALQFADPGFLTTLESLLEQTGFPAELLELELTESLIMENLDLALEKMARIRALGCGLSIDDFGTGYSSLAYLKRFPADIVKIDRSFVRDITTDPADAALIQGIIAMTHGLGRRIIAEGVETGEQVRFIRELNCAYAQGYFYSKPLPPEEIPAFMHGFLEAGTNKIEALDPGALKPSPQDRD